MRDSNFFKGKKILVTGSTSGLGLELVHVLNTEKAALLITGRNKEKLFSIREQLRQNNPYFGHAIAADLIQLKDLENLAESIDVLDGIVLCAGVIDYTPAKMISSDKIKQIFQINFESNVLLIQNLLKKKKIAKNASIVFVSSVVALTGLPSTSLYAASKAALNSYARVLASELAPQRIRVNCISPGIIKTNFIEREGVLSVNQLTNLEDKYPFGFGKPEDISSIIMFLLSDDSKWITGTNILIDGGYMLQ
jgi:NAD(P)-dependent dehydrogenase (short-subunit alcohol dehydrogenase family)